LRTEAGYSFLEFLFLFFCCPERGNKGAEAPRNVRIIRRNR